MYFFREYGYYTMESLIATAFGRYVNLQRGETELITEDVKEVLKSTHEEAIISPAEILVCLCRFHDTYVYQTILYSVRSQIILICLSAHESF